MARDSVVVLIGKRNSGKSCLVKDLMYNCFRDIPAGLVISGSESVNEFYSDMVPGICIRHDFKPEHIRSLFDRQRQVKIQSKKSPGIDPRCFLLMDDCNFDQKFARDVTIREVLFNGRHMHITYLLTLQYALGLPPMLRSQVDYCMVLKMPNIEDQKRIWKYYAPGFPSFDVFSKVFEKLTANYGCVVFDNTSNSGRLEDSVFWYRSSISMPPFKMCAPQLWKMDEQARKNRELEDARDGAGTGGGSRNELQTFSKSPRVFVQKLME